MQPASGALLTQASYRLWQASRQIEPVDAAAGESVAISNMAEPMRGMRTNRSSMFESSIRPERRALRGRAADLKPVKDRRTLDAQEFASGSGADEMPPSLRNDGEAVAAAMAAFALPEAAGG